MKQITKQDLPVSEVRFIDENGRHEYRLGFDELTGVTGVLKATIFKDKYAGIDEATLINAARRGTAIHEAVQQYEMEGVFTPFSIDTDYIAEAQQAFASWLKDRKKHDFRTVDVEYLVTNNVDIASKIDMVMQSSDGRIILGDIKTTSKLDKDYLSWQLSFYKYFFEDMTGMEVSDLIGLWYDRYKNKWTFAPIKVRSREDIDKLIEDWRNGTEVASVSSTLPAPLVDLGQMYAEMERAVKEATAKRDEFRSRMLDAMKEAGVKTFEAEGFRVTYVEPSTRQTFNKDKALEIHPDLADVEGIWKTSTTAESIKITLK